MDQLRRPELRGAVRSALARMGQPAVPAVAAWLGRGDLEPSLRRALPRVLGRIPTQSSVDVLMGHLLDRDPVVARTVHAASVRLRTDYPSLRFPRRAVEGALNELARRHRLLQAARRALADLPSLPGPELLRRSVQETLDEHRAVCLDLLVLRHDPEDIERARHGLRPGASEEAKSAALELLENLIAPSVRPAALTLLESGGGPAERPRPSEGLSTLLDGPSSWLRACAAHVAAGMEDPGLRARVEAARADPNPFVREAAGRALSLTADPDPPQI